MRFVILHYHFLKNAGTSVEELLHRSFGGYFQTIDTTDRDGHVTHETLLSLLRSNPLLKAVSSHQLRYPMPQEPGFLFFDICFLRDPIDRVRSIYDYFREKPAAGDPVSELACSRSLGDFIAELVENMPWHVNDAQVNLLANGVGNDPPSVADFQRAMGVMYRTSLLGVVDLFDQSLAAGSYFLRPIFPELRHEGEPANVIGGLASTLDKRIERLRDACQPRIFDKLMELNSGDLKLLELARAEVTRRFNLSQPASHSPALQVAHS